MAIEGVKSIGTQDMCEYGISRLNVMCYRWSGESDNVVKSFLRDLRNNNEDIDRGRHTW